MKWPPGASDRDALIVRDETLPDASFVVHGSRGPQFRCSSYGAAEARALSYARQACSRVWYADGRGLQLIDSFVRAPVSSPNWSANESGESRSRG
jgi:hypothetical protein